MITPACYFSCFCFVPGTYLRNEAGRLDRLRIKWRKEVGSANDREFALSNKEKCGKSLTKAHKSAAKELFRFFNAGLDWDEVDLHHLRLFGGEAVEMLVKAMKRAAKKVVDTSRRGKWLEVISGAGLHSKSSQRGESGTLNKYVRKTLKKWQSTKEFGSFELEEANRGAFIVTFQQYSGESPCFGFFYCKDRSCGPKERGIPLGKSWASKEVWHKDRSRLTFFNQACFQCDMEGRRTDSEDFPCKPFKIRHQSERRPKYLRSYTRGVSTPRGEHHEELCEKCRSLGRLCTDGYRPSRHH